MMMQGTHRINKNHTSTGEITTATYGDKNDSMGGNSKEKKLRMMKDY